MNILSHISSPEDYKFIRKFYNQFNKNNIKYSFVTTSVYMWLYLKSKGEFVSIIKIKNNSKIIEGSFNEKSGYLDDSNIVGDMYHSVREWADIFNKKNKLNLIIIPSGRLITQQALNDFAKENNIKTIFIGYGNIPGKTILDSLGTDRNSSLFLNCSSLDDAIISNFDYNDWYKKFYSEKITNNIIPQARKIDHKFLFKRFIRTCFCKLDVVANIAHDINYSFSKIPWDILNPFDRNKSKVTLNYIDVRNVNQSFVFFAMQLSNDTQIIQNYEYDIYTALDVAIKLANDKNLKLVVKPHPAEVDINVDKHLSKLEKNNSILLSNSNTFKLIEMSDFVIVVNSTVGLEAKILGKDVIFLGDSFFKKLDNDRIKSYVLDYLYDIDYFSAEYIDEDTFIKIKNRLF